MRAHVRAYIIG